MKTAADLASALRSLGIEPSPRAGAARCEPSVIFSPVLGVVRVVGSEAEACTGEGVVLTVDDLPFVGGAIA